MTSSNTVAITGNTYPVKDALKALGGRWNADRKAWMVPADKAVEAQRLVGGASKPAYDSWSRPAAPRAPARRSGKPAGYDRNHPSGDPYHDVW